MNSIQSYIRSCNLTTVEGELNSQPIGLELGSLLFCHCFLARLTFFLTKDEQKFYT